MRSAIKRQAYSRHCFDGLPCGVMILWKLELVGIPTFSRSYSSEYWETSWKIGMTALRLGDLFLESGDGLSIIPGSNCRYSRFERAGFFDALGPHVFQKLRPDS